MKLLNKRLQVYHTRLVVLIIRNGKEFSKVDGWWRLWQIDDVVLLLDSASSRIEVCSNIRPIDIDPETGDINDWAKDSYKLPKYYHITDSYKDAMLLVYWYWKIRFRGYHIDRHG